MANLADYEGTVAALKKSGFQQTHIRTQSNMGDLLNTVSPRNVRMVRHRDGQIAIVASPTFGLGGSDVALQCSVMSAAESPSATADALPVAIKAVWPNAEVWASGLNPKGYEADAPGPFYVRLGETSDKPLVINFFAGPAPSAPEVEILMLQANRAMAGAVN